MTPPTSTSLPSEVRVPHEPDVRNAPGILLLGPVALRGADGTEISFRSRRQRVLLALLASRPRRVVPAAELVEAMWGDELPENPSAALQSQAHRLRRALEALGAGLVGDAAGYRLVCSADEVDAARFEALLEQTRSNEEGSVAALSRMEEALALWRGRAFGDVADAAALAAGAARLDELRAAAEEERAMLLLGTGRYREAEEAAAGVQDEHPYRERPVAVRMRALAREGRAVDALRLYEHFRRRLGDELGVEPSPVLRAVEGEILRHESRLAPAVGLPGNSFLGREVELADVAGHLAEARLVTLTGPGGVGKTRLALHVAARVADRYADGVHLCELASVSDGTAVAGALAATLQVEEGIGADLQQRIVDVLRPQQVLLVLDNCEHVATATRDLLRAVLSRAPNVSVLATSRQRLGVEGERVVPVRPLATGVESAAVDLFLDRAAAAGAPPLQEPSAVAAIGELCARLDGLPLAIEIAAARSVARSPDELLADVAGRLDELADHRRSVERHRSLEAAVGWSYDLLSTNEQRVLRAMSVFAGGWTAPAAAAVIGEPVRDVVDTLTALVDHSLVIARSAGDGTRYSMLEPVRQFAEHRVAPGERDELSTAHAAWAVSWLGRADVGLRTSEEPLWAAAIDAELANIRAALSWCLDHDPLSASDIVAALYWYAYWYGTAEVFDWADRTVEVVSSMTSPRVAAALATAAAGSCRRGDLDRARMLAERAIALAQGTDPGAARFAWEALRSAELLSGDYARALEHRDAALLLARASGDTVHEVHAHVAGALIRGYLGRREDAEAELATAAELLDAHAHPTERAFHDYVAGEIRIDTSPTEALPFLWRSVESARRIGNRFIAGIAGVSAVSCAARVGDPSAAIAGYAEVIEFLHRAGAWPQLWTTLRTLVETLTRSGRYEPAAILHGALTSSPTAPAILGTDEVRMAEVVAELRERLGDERLAALQTKGAGFSGEQAYAYALRAVR
jgi:predicted ATPase/DNA-binding winged helix-turn-helix (wHTH) protein